MFLGAATSTTRNHGKPWNHHSIVSHVVQDFVHPVVSVNTWLDPKLQISHLGSRPTFCQQLEAPKIEVLGGQGLDPSPETISAKPVQGVTDAGLIQSQETLKLLYI